MKKYQIIYADPPWDYHFITRSNYDKPKKLGGKYAPCKSADFHYNFMKNEEIYSLPINLITDNNCLLFLWATSPKLDIALETIKRWGFEYKTVAFVWYKQSHMPGNYTVSSCELCLVAKRGSIPKPRGARNIKQLVSEKRTTHSRKPDEVRDRIMAMFPAQSKIELFARIKREGWDVWGNEVESDIELEIGETKDQDIEFSLLHTINPKEG